MGNVYEYVEGREMDTKPPRASYMVIANGYDDERAARSAILNWAPGTVTVGATTLYRQNLHVEQNGRADDMWMGRIEYAISRIPVQFDTSGSTTRMMQSFGTRSFSPKNSTAPDFRNGINYNEASGCFDGVDITIPAFSWTETYTFNVDKLTWGYIKTIATLTGCVNNSPFRTFAAGEVLFLGASGGCQKNESEADIMFRFTASPNRSNLTVAGISGISKYGWEYLWVAYRDGVDTEGRKYKEAIGAYVEQVYRTASFSGLDI
jgi:hypothetical protein